MDQQNWTNYPGKILRLNLDGSIPDGKSFYLITDEGGRTTGQVVSVFKALQAGVNEISIAGVPAGIYILNLSSKDQSWQERVLKSSYSGVGRS